MFLPSNQEIYDSGIARANVIATQTVEDLSDLVIQLSMAKEYSEIDALFTEGETLNLSVDDFLQSPDKNVQSLIKVLYCLRDFQDLIRDI